jgi:imidazolonepropionase-like amidohydrolase
VDGTDKPPIEDATVVIRAGRIAAAGARNAVPIPTDVRVIDVRGKTILPGLWDMHAHASQIEWAPAYLGAGVTTVRDMGGETPFLSAFRDTLATATAIGPQLLLAGLVDGPGPNGFGAVIAATPAEGRAIVDAYRARGFRQIKLYNSITAPVAGAIIRHAHELGMTVTGHVPNAMGLRAVIDSGMDHVAHMPLSGDVAAVRETIAFLSAKHTVIDPTIAWNELLGRAPSTLPESFEPGIRLSPAPLALNYASVRNRTDSAVAAHDQARGLSIFKAMYDAGIPIVAGTDGGVPGHSVFREIELSVAAGLTARAAIQSATIVAARAMGMERDHGTVEAGKVADLLILDADPLTRIDNIRTGRWVISRGRMYDCAVLWKAAGFAPAQRR